MASPSFHRKVIAMVHFRDIAHGIMEQKDGKKLSERHYQDYCNLRFDPEVDLEQFRSSEILDIWDSAKSHPFMQALQYANYVKPFVGDGDHTDDTRLWDVFSSFPFSPNHITIPFMKLDLHNNANRKARKDEPSLDIWRGEPSTPFERIIFLMILIHLSKEDRTTTNGNILGKRKRFPYFKKTRLNSQKLAFALQRVIRIWDRLARSFGFRSVEKMFIPYMIPSTNFSCFRSLPKREDGYAPIDIQRTFSERLNATENEELVVPSALRYTDDVDEGLRRLARHFLSDLHLVAEDEEFYGDETNTWKYGDSFPKEGPIERFYSMVGELRGLQDALGIEEELEFLSTEVPVAMTTTTPVQNKKGVCDESCRCRDARDLIKSVMLPFCRMHNTGFEDIIDVDTVLRPQDSSNIVGNVQLVITDPPHKLREEEDMDASDSDKISEAEMEKVVNIISNMLRPGGYAIIFCSDEQASMWKMLLADSCSIDEDGTEEQDFEVDTNTLIFTYKPSTCTAHKYDGRNTKKATDQSGLKNATLRAVRAMKLGCSRKDAANMTRLRHFGHVKSRQPASTNVIDNVERVPEEEILRCNDGQGEHGVRRALVGKISVDLFKELICRYSLPGDLLVDLFSGLFASTVAACTIPGEEMRIVVGSEIDEDLYIHATRKVQVAFSSVLADEAQRISVFPNKEFSEEVIEAARFLVSHTAKASTPKTLWSRPPGLPELSILPRYITEYLCLIWTEAERLSLIDGKPFHIWPVDMQGKMNYVDFEYLLALECMRRGVYIAPSKIRHKEAGLGVFANRTFSVGDYVAPYYGRLVYEDLSNRLDRTKEYGEGFTACDGDSFLNYSMALKISTDAKFKNMLPAERLQHTENRYREVYVVPFLFTVAARINDARSLAGSLDRILTEETRSYNVEFVQKIPCHKFTKLEQLCDTDALAVVAKAHIKKGTELYVDYGPEHKLNVIQAYRN